MKIFTFLFEVITIAYNSLKANLLRTGLTMLGVALGIFAMTIIFTLVNSLQFSIGKNLSSLGNTIIFVHNWPWKDNSADWFKYMGRPKMSYSDFQKLENNLKNVEGVCYDVNLGRQTVKHNRKNYVTGVDVKGVTQEYALVNTLDFMEGRFFSPIESNSGRPICVLGYNVARALLKKQPFVGQQVTVNGKKLKVVGVIDQVGSTFFGTSMDDRLFMPYAYAAKVYNLKPRRRDKVITIRVDDHKNLELVESEVIGLIRANRGLKPSVPDNFSVNKQEMLMKQLDDVFWYLRVMGLIISGFTILVGGFGIGNIMYTTVKERTFEIGLQKALGATRGFILSQFLIEAILVCVLGGMVGLVLLFSSSQMISYSFDRMDIPMDIIVSGKDVANAMIISVVIGLTSGIFPSIFASGLDPVESMRS